MMVKEVESMNTVSASSMVVFSAQPLCGDIESTQVEENQVLYNGHFLDLESRI